MATVECKKCKATTAVTLEATSAAPSVKPVASPPQADFLIITWTEAETGALATVFGEAKYHFTSAPQFSCPSPH